MNAGSKRWPIFDVVLDYLPSDQLRVELGGIGVTAELFGELTKVPITLTVIDHGGSISLRTVYQSALFESVRIEHFLSQLEYLLQQVIVAPHIALDRHSLATPTSHGVSLPDPTLPLAVEAMPLIPECFWRWVREQPDLPAIVQGSTVWTYGELGVCVGAIVVAISESLPQRGAVIAVLGSASNDMIAGMLAAIIAGGAVLSLDRRLPPYRLEVMCREAKPKLLLRIGRPKPEDIWVEGIDIPILAIDALPGLPECGRPQVPIESSWVAIEQDDAAYVIFTTGTTSTPKGVLGRHRGIAHFLAWERERFGVNPSDRFAQLTNLAFDMALRDVFLPLTSGSCLHLLHDPADLSANTVFRMVESVGISVLHVVPTLVEAWCADLPPGQTYPSVRCVMFAGEPLSHGLVLRARAVFVNAVFVNLYGPTETTQSACCFVVPEVSGAGVQPIGMPLPGAQALVLNRNGEMCGIGEPGEIAVRTPYRSLGYLNASDDLEARFRINPFREDRSDMLFFSRDRGRFRLDGSLDILGRIDQVVKIRGVFVNPDHVSGELVSHSAIFRPRW